MTRAALALIAAGTSTLLMLLLIAGHGPWSGATIWDVTENHGINVGDLPVLGLWLVGLAACGLLVRRVD